MDTATEGKPEKVHQSVCTINSEYLMGLSISESYINVLVEACDGSLQMLHGYQHVLDHVVLFVKTPDGFALREFQQRDLWRNHPSKKPAEQWVVAEWDDILEKRHKYTQPVTQTG